MNSSYEFRSRWHVRRDRESLWDELELLLDTNHPIPWWPSVQVVSYDGDDLELHAASHLGYGLTFRLSQLEARRPDSLTFRSEGDLRGTGEVTFLELDTDSSAMDIDWRVELGTSWMRRMSWLLRPAFVAGHHLVMRQGEKHLNAWLASKTPR